MLGRQYIVPHTIPNILPHEAMSATFGEDGSGRGEGVDSVTKW